jgi:putative transposase
MRYRRDTTAGGTYFFTVNLADRKQQTLIEHIDLLQQSVSSVRTVHPFDIIAWVVLPEHMHAIWRLPPDDFDYSMRWGLIKAGFSRQLAKSEYIGKSRQTKGERGIWQRRFWEHRIRNARDLENHIRYIQYNPVKHGYVKHASEWPFSVGWGELVNPNL